VSGAPAPTERPLWRHREFTKFLAGQTVSLFGSQFTVLALPLTAVLTLHASPVQMGLLGAMQFVAPLGLGLFMGVWLDRVRRRPVIVMAQLLSAAALACVPISAALHVLGFGELCLVALFMGAATSLSTIAQTSYLPALVGGDHLVQANARLTASRTVAQLTGPPAAGVVVQLVTAPVAIAVDAVSFLVGAATAAWVRATEPPPSPAGERRRVVAEAADGLRYLWREPVIRAIVLAVLVANLSSFFTDSVYYLLFVGHRGVTPLQLGVISASGSVTALLATRVAGPLARRLGTGRVLIGGLAVISLGELTAAVAALTPGAAVLPLLVAGQAIGGVGLSLFNINQIALRQTIVPNRLMARVSAGSLVAIWSAHVVGSLAGGGLGQVGGLRTALIAGSSMSVLCVLPALLSPLRGVGRPLVDADAAALHEP
jgi:MFS family permease